MLDRHALRTGVSLLLATAAPALLACSSSSSSNVHGPVFGGDGGPDSSDASEPDAGDDASSPVDATATDGHTGTDATTDAPGDTTSDAPVDAGTETGAMDATTDATPPTDGPGCPSTMAVVATGPSSVAESVFSAGQWSMATTTAGGGASPPSGPVLVPFGTEYLAAYVAAGTGSTALESTLHTIAWSVPAPVAAATGQGTPGLATIGATAHLVYWGSDGMFYHGSFTGAAWDTANDPLEGDAGQSFGSSSPAVAAVGSTLVVAQSGTNNLLYDQSWTAGSWGDAIAHAGSSVVATIAPAIVALTGGSADLMIVFVHDGDAGDYHLQYTVRTGGTWSAPADVYDQGGTIAYSGSAPSLAALPGGGAIVAWQGGTPAYPYASTYTSGGTWSTPAAIAQVSLASPPSVATGVCGATAVAAFAQTTGELDVATLTGTTWSAPLAITNASGVQSVAVASSP